MSKVIIAVLLLLFCLIFLLLFWIVIMSLALLVFSKKGRDRATLQPEARVD